MLTFPSRCATLIGLALLVSLASGSVPAELPAVGKAGAPPRTLNAQESTAWLAGRRLFDRRWTEDHGLGAPGFNAESCASCHNAPALGGAGANEHNVIRFRGDSGYDPNRMFTVGSCGFSRPPESFDIQATMRKFRDRRANKSGISSLEEIQTPSLFGLGLIATIPDAEILKREDPSDRDGDGVRGVARRLEVNVAEEIGRFGWKAQTPRLSDFVCMALAGEVGVTAPEQGRGFGLAKDSDSVSDPEISDADFEHLNFYVENLAAPRRASGASYQAQVGERLFAAVGCTACHVPTLEGSEGPVPLYSDLLLHEIVETNEAQEKASRVRRSRRRDDRKPEPSGFRTAPLWGVGSTAPYLHDGSAATLREAVLGHGKEALSSREEFERLETIDQEALLAFLKSL